MHRLPWQQRRVGVEAILTRIADDPAYRRQLQSDPGQSLVTVDVADELFGGDEVTGYCKVSCAYTCKVTRRPR